MRPKWRAFVSAAAFIIAGATLPHLTGAIAQPDSEKNAPAAKDGKPQPPTAPKPEGSMTLERIGTLIKRLDKNAKVQTGGRHWQFAIKDVQVAIVADPKNNRMRILIPLKRTGGMPAAELKRLSQANFDTALDVRYAIGKDILWATYIHPLSELHDRQFIAAIGQTVNAARTYGTTYSSGLLSYGGGDSQGIIRRQLIDELLKKGGQDI